MADYTINDFDIKKLGSFYTKDSTTFRVFAPNSKEMFLLLDDSKYYMTKNHFIFEISIKGNFEKSKYCYINDDNDVFKDPFSYCSDEKYSYVLDTSKFINEKVYLEKAKSKIIYETSVRDFSCNEEVFKEYSRKLLAFSVSGLNINGNSVGLDYLKELGINYLQLMPILDFDNDGSNYNWGYNPIAFNYINPDYIYDVNNLYAFINEFRHTVNVLHSNNIRVNLDVVFNHVYRAFDFDLEKMLKGNALRKKEDGSLALGSLCGNEIKSEDIFVREYLKEMTLRYINLFDIDGIRIDQMGILDLETVNQIYDCAIKLKNDFMVYGEGWNMGDVLPEDKRATIMNAYKMPNISMFNDYCRNTLINYICGNDSIRGEVKSILCGFNNNMNNIQSINYVECHDNLTFFDRMLKYKGEDPVWINTRRCKLALAMILVSRGVAFIHSGQEFLRTKNFIDNSYNFDEDINKLDWNRRIENKDVVDYFKGLVLLRKENDEFNKDNVNVVFEDYYDCIVYKLDSIKIIINPSRWDHMYQDGKDYRVIFDVNGKCDYINRVLSIPAYSLIITKA